MNINNKGVSSWGCSYSPAVTVAITSWGSLRGGFGGCVSYLGKKCVYYKRCFVFYIVHSLPAPDSKKQGIDKEISLSKPPTQIY